MSKEIRHKLFFPQAPEEVWEYLTDSDLMSLWLMPNDFKPVVGHDFRFKVNPLPQMGFDGISYCKVLEIVPFKKLSYSWKAGPGEGQITVDTLVVWTLIPKEKGTELDLVHSGFEESVNPLLYTGMFNGWLQNMKKIAASLNTKTHGATHA